MNILVREAPNIQEPYMIAQYDYAVYEERNIANLNVEQIEQALKELVEKGATLPKLQDDEQWFDVKREDEAELRGFHN
jgi:hypothetical protein